MQQIRTQPQDIIAQLESDNSRLGKEAILARALNEDLTEFFDGLRMCLDCMYTFGVKQVPIKERTEGQGLAWPVFLDLAQKLHKRELTGHAARDAIALAMSAATQDQWNGFYRRILIKDLRCGVSEKTVNKVCKAAGKLELGVPVFSCQLAHDGEKHKKKVVGKKLIEVKLDGVRMVVIASPDGTVETFSRNGKELSNFPKITEQYSEFAKKFLQEPMVFDGEVMSSSFQDLMKQVHRKEGAQTDDATFFVFDMIPFSKFAKGRWNKDQQTRSESLRHHVQIAHDNGLLANTEFVEHVKVDLDTDAGQAEFEKINRDAIAGGYEGIMLKDPEAPYECKRTHSWLKVKPVIEVTLTVVAVEEGTGKNEGILGALVCKGVDDGCEIHVNVGSGFSDAQRKQFWDFKNLIVGRLVEVRADAITQNQDGTYSLRFPRFKTFRDYAPGEKI